MPTSLEGFCLTPHPYQRGPTQVHSYAVHPQEARTAIPCPPRADGSLQRAVLPLTNVSGVSGALHVARTCMRGDWAIGPSELETPTPGNPGFRDRSPNAAAELQWSQSCRCVSRTRLARCRMNDVGLIEHPKPASESARRKSIARAGHPVLKTCTR